MAYNVGAVVGHIRLDTTGWTQPRDAILRDVRNLGYAFTALGGAIAMPVVKAVQEYGKFEQAMRKATSVSIVTEEQFGRMSKAAEQASVRFNIAAEEAAKGYLFLGRAGLTAEKQMLAFGPVTMAAKAMMEDLEETAEGTVNVMNAFAIGFEHTAQVTDVLTNAVNGSTLNLNELLVSLSYAGKPAKAFNNTLEETAAMLALVANEGIRGSKSGTALKFAMTALASPTAEARRILHQLRIDVYKANGEMTPLISIMEQLEEKFKDTGEEFRNVVLESLFGRRALPTMIALFDQTSQVVRKTADSYKKLGITETTVDKQMVAMRERWGQMVQGVRMLARHLGQTLAPRIIEITKNVRDQIDVWVAWVDTHQKAVEEMVKRAADIAASVVLWGLLGAAFTIVLGVGRDLVGVITSLVGAVFKMASAFLVFAVSNPWLMAIAAGLLLIAGMAYIVRARWDDFIDRLGAIRDKFGDMFDTMKEKVNEFAEFASDKAGIIGRALVKMFPKWYTEGAKNTLKGMADFAKTAVSTLGKLKTYPEYSDFSEFKPGYAPFAKGGTVGGAARTAVGVVQTEYQRTMDALKTQIGKDMASLKEFGVGLGEDAGAGLMSGFDKATDWMKGKIDELTGGILGKIFAVREKEKKVPEAVAGAMTGGLERGTLVWVSRFQAITEELKGAWDGAMAETKRSLDTLDTMFQSVQQGMVDGWTTAFDSLMQKGSSFGSFMDQVFQTILVNFRQMVATMAAQELLGRITGQDMSMWLGGTEGVSLIGTFSSLFGQKGYNKVKTEGAGGYTYPDNMIKYSPKTIPQTAGASPKVVLSVTNNGAPVALKQVGEQMVGRDMVVSYVMEEMQTNPDFRDLVRGGGNG